MNTNGCHADLGLDLGVAVEHRVAALAYPVTVSRDGQSSDDDPADHLTELRSEYGKSATWLARLSGVFGTLPA
jgi:hypothetical protein